MKLHLVGGFLGSGKTTAIIHAARRLLRTGARVGIVTNDQGKYLVDTAFFRAADLPAVEITGGCFCCNYQDLETTLRQYETQAHPDVIFAESVGSCADLVATVVKPLQAFYQAGLEVHSLSIFTDSRLLHRRLRGLPLPFSDNVIYIFDKQIEEAGLLILNKMDLLTPEDAKDLVDRARRRYSDRRILPQTSTTEEGILGWTNLLSNGGLLPGTSLGIDYDRYGAGEAELAWLNEEIELCTPPGEGRQAVMGFLENLLEGLGQKGYAIGHLKVWVKTPHCSVKLSIPTLAQPAWQNDLPFFPDGHFSLLLNARVEAPAEGLADLLGTALEALRRTAQAVCTEKNRELFHPSYPRPQHRMG